MTIQVKTTAVERAERGERRFPVYLPALLLAGGEAWTVRLRDLSRTGALVEAPAPPPPGTALRLRVERLTTEARVVWTKGARFGLAFEAPIRATDLLVLLGRHRQQSRPRG